MTQKITFEQDCLGREKYADFLIKAIQIGQSEEGSFTIAIDAKYGSGKTWFLKMLEHKINENYASTGCDHPLVAIRYDAWKYDFFDEPLVPLMEQIMGSEALVDEAASANEKECFKKLMKTLKNYVGLKCIPDLKQAFHEAQEHDNEQVKHQKRLSGYQEILDELQEAISNAANVYGENGKLLIIIDELDRCRPDFAIRTLEVTKHLLNSKNVVFLYAIDMTQLGRSVEAMYGAGIDWQGYLLRFFNYVSVMPAIGKTAYFAIKLDQILPRENQSIFLEMVHEGKILRHSYRDIDRIISAFSLVKNTLLTEYPKDEAYLVYFYLIYLKYLNRGLFNKLIAGSYVDGFRESKDFASIADKRLNAVMDTMTQKRRIEYDPTNNYMTITQPGTKKELCVIGRESRNTDVTYYISDGGYRTILRQDSYICPGIYYPDVVKIMNSKGISITIAQYIHTQLEMYGLEWTEQPEERF